MKIVEVNKNTIKTIKFVLLACLFTLAFGIVGACADGAGKKATAAIEEKKVEEVNTEEKALTKIDRYTEPLSSNYVDAFVLKYKGKEYIVVTSYTGAHDGGGGVAIHEIKEKNMPSSQQNE